MSWLRARFSASDSRPIKWPPPGPFWESGFNDDWAIVIAWVRKYEQINEFWPEAHEIETTEHDEITYSSRFIKPDWYNPPPAEEAQDE